MGSMGAFTGLDCGSSGQPSMLRISCHLLSGKRTRNTPVSAGLFSPMPEVQRGRQVSTGTEATEQRAHLSELKAKDLRLRYISCSCCSSCQLLFSTARFTLEE